jgi:hypothetical protein
VSPVIKESFPVRVTRNVGAVTFPGDAAGVESARIGIDGGTVSGVGVAVGVLVDVGVCVGVCVGVIVGVVVGV